MLGKTIPIATSAALAIGGAFAVVAPQAFAEFTSNATIASNHVHAGTLQVQIVDATGQQLTAPIINLTDAAPAMSTKSYSLRLRNLGSLPAAVAIHVGSVVDATANSLNDVLVATVKNAGGTTLYTGSLTGLSVELASIAAASTEVLTLELTWPDLPAVDDNPYQDAAITFAVLADGSQLVV